MRNPHDICYGYRKKLFKSDFNKTLLSKKYTGHGVQKNWMMLGEKYTKYFRSIATIKNWQNYI